MWADAVSGKLLVRGADAFDHAHDVGLLHNQEVLAVDLDFRPRPFAEQDSVACFQFQTLKLAALVAGAGPHSDDLALLRLLLDGVGDDDAALRLVLAFHAADHDAVMQRSEFHGIRFQSTGLAGSRATTLALGGSLTRTIDGDRWHSLQESANISKAFRALFHCRAASADCPLTGVGSERRSAGVGLITCESAPRTDPPPRDNCDPTSNYSVLTRSSGRRFRQSRDPSGRGRRHRNGKSVVARNPLAGE